MNFYNFFPSDYWTATHTLTWLEDCAYRRMLDLFYRTERPIPSDREVLYRELRAQTPEQKDAVELILKRYWKKPGGRAKGYVQRKASKVLRKARERRAMNVFAGKQSALARNKRSTRVQQSLNLPYPYPEPKPEACSNPSSQDHMIKHKKRESRAAPAAQLALSPAMIAFAKSKNLNPQREFEKFAAYNSAKGNHLAEPYHAWVLWCLRAPQFNGDEPTGPTIDEQVAEYERRTGRDIYTGKRKTGSPPTH